MSDGNSTPTPRPNGQPTADPGPTLALTERESLLKKLGTTAGSLPAAFSFRYILAEELARGGMGIVYKATDAAFGREVAVKVLQDGYGPSSGAASRFAEEARITGQLQHPSVPPVHDLGTLPDGRAFLAMKLIKGKTLDTLLSERANVALDRGRFIAIFESICQALAYAHARDVIHRDLKPANVMVGSFGEVQVMDWGLAKVLTGQPQPEPEPASDHGKTVIESLRETDGSFTRAGSVLGTPAFIPPEQAAGVVGKVDKRSDVFGLGAILAVILTGKPPFAAESVESMRVLAACGDVTECFVRLDRCEADPELVGLCKRCLNPKREGRPADAGEVAHAVAELRTAADERAQRAELDRVKAEAKMVAAKLQAAEQRKRRRMQLALAVAVGLLVVCGGAFGWYQDRQWTAQRVEEADRQRDARERLGRNAEAVAGLLDQCEGALHKGDEAQASLALEAARRRMEEGGAEDLTLRLKQRDEDLTALRDLNAADVYLWTTVEDKYPEGLPLERYRKALSRFGVSPKSTSPAEAGARLSMSAVRDRLAAALDLWLAAEKDAWVREVLRTVDQDTYRNMIRNAVLAGDGTRVTELANRPEIARQPPGFVAVVGSNPSIPAEWRRQLLSLAIRDRADNLGLLMSMGGTYPIMHWHGAAERARWFQAAVGVAPGNAAAHNNLGIALRDLGELDAAFAEFQEVIRLDPRSATGQNNLGVVQLLQGDAKGAVEAFREAVRLNENFAAFHENLGEALRHVGDLKGAVASGRRAIELEPDSAIAHNNLGAALDDSGLDGADAEYQKALELNPRLATAHYNLGNSLHKKGDWKGAIAKYRESIQYDPDYVSSRLKLGNLLRERGDWNGAVAEYREMVRLLPKSALAHNNLGDALCRKGALDEAVTACLEALRLDPKYTAAHVNLGNALLFKKNLEGAIAQYREAIRIDPKLVAAHICLGEGLLASGDLTSSVDAYREAIRLDPNLATSHNGLGALLHAKGELDDAIAECREAIRLDPKLVAAHKNLGDSLRAKGDLDGAVAAYRDALKLDRNDIPIRNSLGNTLNDKGEPEAAIAEFKEVIRLNPRIASVHNNLGWSLQAKGDLDAAIAAYRESLRLDPKLSPALVNLTRALTMRELLPRLPAIVDRKAAPKTSGEACEFARLCTQPFQNRFTTAVWLYEIAIAADPNLANNLDIGIRYEAARAAARAARGDGVDAPKDAADRAKLRAKAMALLRADLSQWKVHAASRLATIRKKTSDTLARWLEDPLLAALRSDRPRMEMTAAEREDWDALWADVRATLNAARNPPRISAPPPRLKG